MWPNPHETAELVTFNEEIVNGKREKKIFIQTMHENWMFCATFNLKLIAIFKMQHWPFAVDFNLLRHYPENSWL